MIGLHKRILKMRTLILYAFLVSVTSGQSLVTDDFIRTTCPNTPVTLTCPSSSSVKYTILLEESLYGIKSSSQSGCVHSSTDCYSDVTKLFSCSYNQPTCLIIPSATYKVPNCNDQVAQYLHLVYNCVPISSLIANAIPEYNICDQGDITSSNGFVKSPGYTSFSVVANECSRKIVAPADKIMNIWVVDVNIKPAINQQCPNDYVKIVDSVGTYITCGINRLALKNDLCSSQVIISYKAATQSVLYRGFSIYYEFVDRSTQPFCSTGIPLLTTTPSGQTPSTTSEYVPLLVDHPISDIFQKQVCRGFSDVILPIRDYTLFPIDVFYGVTQSLQCEPISTSHCKAPAPLNCNFMSGTCSISLQTLIPIADCSRQPATYFAIRYRYVPLYSSRNYSLCYSPNLDATSNPYGVMTSPNYPLFTANLNCASRIQAPANKVIRIYISDILLEEQEQAQEGAFSCTRSFIQFKNSDNDPGVKFCGQRDTTGTYTFTSCSNFVIINYVSSGASSLPLRGVNIFYETIDKGNINCATLVLPTTTRGTTTEPPLITTMTGLVQTSNGGNCFLPFTYQGVKYDKCISTPDNIEPWCATTPNYDSDMKRGNCLFTPTSTIGFEICPAKYESMNCPKDFVLSIVAAEYGVTSDDSCDYTKSICTASAMTAAKTCAGRQTCLLLHTSRNLVECTNRRSNYMHVEFSCIPTTVPSLATNDLCTPLVLNNTRGFIQTRHAANLNCKQILNVVGNNKIANIYAVDVALRASSLGQDCDFDVLSVDDGIEQKVRVCGTIKAERIYQSCSNRNNQRIELHLITGSTTSLLYSGIKLFYEIVDRTTETVCVPPPPTQTTSTRFTSTTTLSPYIAAGLTSPTQSKTFCKNVLDIIGGPNIACPNSYMIILRQAFYGIAPSSECYYTQGDCISYRSNPATACNGKQNCTVIHLATNLPECNNAASTYLYIEYDCVPLRLVSQARDMCGQTFLSPNGMIKSKNYPTYDTITMCQAKIQTDSSKIIKAYVIDGTIADESCQDSIGGVSCRCTTDSLSFEDLGNITYSEYCGQIQPVFALETCTNTLTIKYQTRSSPLSTYKGVLIYYEAIDKPLNWICTSPTTTKRTTTTTTTTTTRTTTTITRPTNYGLSLAVQYLASCQTITQLQCPPEYVIVLFSVDYVAQAVDSAGCSYSPIDCAEPTTLFNSICSGKQSCSLVFSERVLPNCQNKKAKYFYITYQCVPSVNAGRPIPQTSVDMCQAGFNNEIKIDSSLLIRSPEYPKYPIQNVKCTKRLVSASGKALLVYALDAKFKGSGLNCNTSTDYLKLSDCSLIPPQYLCGNVNYASLLLNSLSNNVTIEYSATGLTTQNINNKGFLLYVEAYDSNKTCNSIFIAPTVSVKPPPNGFASDLIHAEVCADSERKIQCPLDYYVILHEEHWVYTGEGCKHTRNECKQPTDFANKKCSAKSECDLYVLKFELIKCQNQLLDYLDVEFQCVPATKATLNTYTCLDDKQEIYGAQNGFISSPSYPNYLSEIKNCKLNLTPRDGYGYKVFIIDLAMNDPQNGSCSIDFVNLNGMELCAIDEPRLLYVTDGKSPFNHTLSLIHQSPDDSFDSSSESIRGFKFYFEEYLLKQTTKPAVFTRTNGQINNVINNDQSLIQSKHLTNYSLGVGIPLIVLMVIFVVVILVKNPRNQGNLLNSTINYSRNSDIDDIRTMENPNFSSNSLYDQSNLNFS